MPQPAGLNLAQFFAEVDKGQELRGARVVYFDGATMSALRQGPPVCQSGLLAVVIRKGGKDLLPTSSEIAQAKDQRFNAELLNLGMTCGSILVGWVVIAGTAGAAPITGGTSLIVTAASWVGTAGAAAQCIMAGKRMYNEYVDPHANVDMDDETWYRWFTQITDGASLVGSAGFAAQTFKMVTLLKNSTRKSALEVLKGLSRQERKRLTEELIRDRIPGITKHEIQVLMSRKVLPLKGLSKRFGNDEISLGVRRQLLDAVNNAIGLGSYASSKISDAGEEMRVGDLLFGVVNAYETM